MKLRQLLFSLALVGCSPAPILPPPQSAGFDPAATDGDGQSGTVGEVLARPLVVRVVHEGQPAAGVLVEWTTAGSGLLPSATVTGADGIASTTWRMSPHSGPKFARALLGSDLESSVEFRAEAIAAQPARMVVESGADQSGIVGEPLATPLRVRVVDRFENPVPGAALLWRVNSGGGSLSDIDTLADATGSAAVVWSLGPEQGIQSVEVQPGLGNGGAEFRAAAVPPPVARVDVLVGNLLFLPANITVAPGTAVTWTTVGVGVIPHSVRSNDPSRFASSPILFGDGARYTHIFTEPGVYRYDCAVHGSAMTGTINVI